MAVTAAGAVQGRSRKRKLPQADRLIPLAVASDRLGYSVDTLQNWHDRGHMPAVIGPGGRWSTYESFIDAVLASARPRQAGVIEEIARDWFAARYLAAHPDDAPGREALRA
jgi:hypothetical protein